MEGPDILIVDDDASVREIIAGNLKEKFPGLVCREADTGNKALSLIDERVPDVILVDLRMPGLNGFALTRILRKRDRTWHVPVIAVTGLRDTASVKKAVEAGATDYCVKPIDFDRLAKKIERILTQVLRIPDVRTRHRSAPRRVVRSPVTVEMPVVYPEKEGVWIDSPLEMDEGDPLLFDGSSFFSALRVPTETPYCWSRVDQSHPEEGRYRVKLLFEEKPEEYEEQLRVLNLSRDRFRRSFSQGGNTLLIGFPCELRNLSGEGLQMVGGLPWSRGVVLDLNLGSVLNELSMAAPDARVQAEIRWTEPDGFYQVAGVRFVEIDDELRNQLMVWCLDG